MLSCVQTVDNTRTVSDTYACIRIWTVVNNMQWFDNIEKRVKHTNCLCGVLVSKIGWRVYDSALT